jgi:hypothetical protein
MDSELINHIDTYVRNGGRLLATGFTSTNDGIGKPLNSIRLQSLGVMPGYEVFPQAKSTYLKVSEEDKIALGEKGFKDFSIMMMYSDFLKCQIKSNAQGNLKLVPETRFGPPEKSYYTEKDITGVAGVISNAYGKGASVFIPWQLGSQYHFKGNYAHRALFIAALYNLLKLEKSLETNASPLIEMTHVANRNGAFEWIGMINHSGQIGASLREPIPIHDTNIRFKTAKPVKVVKLMRSGMAVNFRQSNGWVECVVPRLDDFEMLLCLY